MKRMLVAAALCLALAGCGVEPLTAQAVKQAEQACEPNGGLRSVAASETMVRHGRDWTAWCNNGLIIKGRVNQ